MRISQDVRAELVTRWPSSDEEWKGRVPVEWDPRWESDDFVRLETALRTTVNWNLTPVRPGRMARAYGVKPEPCWSASGVSHVMRGHVRSEFSIFDASPTGDAKRAPMRRRSWFYSFRKRSLRVRMKYDDLQFVCILALFRSFVSVRSGSKIRGNKSVRFENNV